MGNPGALITSVVWLLVSILSCLIAYLTIIALRCADPRDSSSPGQYLVSKYRSRSESMSSTRLSTHSLSSSDSDLEKMLHQNDSAALSAAFSPPCLMSLYRVMVRASMLLKYQLPSWCPLKSETSSWFICSHSFSGIGLPRGCLLDIPSVAPMWAPGMCCMLKL